MLPLPPRLKTLERQLRALGHDAMLLSELDGFVAGLIICPELIAPSDWLPLVWGASDDDEGPVFDAEDDIQSLVSGIMAHYNAVADTLHSRPGKFRPIYDVDDVNGEVVWELWADGFTRAVNLRPDAWSGLLQADDENTSAFIVLMTLGAIATSEHPLSGEEVDELTADAADVIPDLVELLSAWRRGRRELEQGVSSRGAKVGRNDPCPCGSGKKYKKCCGAT